MGRSDVIHPVHILVSGLAVELRESVVRVRIDWICERCGEPATEQCCVRCAF
jgi:hypothetical protein